MKMYNGFRLVGDFCRLYSILPNETLAFTAAEIRDGILILDLNEVRSVLKV